MVEEHFGQNRKSSNWHEQSVQVVSQEASSIFKEIRDVPGLYAVTFSTVKELVKLKKRSVLLSELISPGDMLSDLQT
eukprot:4240968-Amphidinium_carterae.1